MTNCKQPPSGRRETTVLSLVVTCLVMFAVVNVSSGGAMATGIHQLSKNLNRAVDGIISNLEVDYDDMPSVADYTFYSYTYFNTRGMAVLYNITNWFVRGLIPKALPVDLLIINTDGSISVKNDDYMALAKNYAGLLTFVILLLIFALLMPICGLCFCCCRCCGKCGGRTLPYEKSGWDLCKKIVYASLLIALGTLFLFTVVCTFVTNNHIRDGSKNLTTSIRISVNDSDTYFKMTNKQVNTLLITNYNQLKDVLLVAINDSTTTIFGELNAMSNASSLLEAEKIVNTLIGAKVNMTTMKVDTNKLRVYASQLNDATRKLKLDTLNIGGDSDKLSNLKDMANHLATNIDFNSIPDLSKYINAIDDEFLEDLSDGIRAGIDNTNKTQNAYKEIMNENLQDVVVAIDQAGVDIKKEADEFNGIVDDSLAYLKDLADNNLSDVDRFINDYGKYRYYVSVAVACVLLLITLCVAFGLICGICGKKPDGYNDDCCNKGAGSKFLICGVAIIFLTTTVLVVVMLIYMVTLAGELLICDPLREPEGNEVMEFLYKWVRANKEINRGILNETVTLQSLLVDCGRNASIYNVFQLQSKINLTELKNTFEDTGVRDNLNNIIEGIEIGPVQLLSTETWSSLEQVANIIPNDIHSSLEKIVEELDGATFTKGSLQDFADEVLKLKDDEDLPPETTQSLSLIYIHVDTYITRLYNPLETTANSVMNSARDTNNNLKGGYTTFSESVNAVMDDIKAAEDFLSNNGTEALRNISTTFTEEILVEIDVYLDRVVKGIEDQVGLCAPMSNAIDGTVTATCDRILTPLNGFWFSIFCALLLFIPTIIIAVKLASLYKKYDRGEDFSHEDEYLYDAYADRENIPLASSKHAKKKAKKKRYESGPPAGHREYAGGSMHPEARYGDMAPKHFEDFPNGGPPQYQRAPTEYERPPPYYYPGSGGK